MNPLGLGAGWPGQGVVFRSRFALRECPFDEHIDDDSVLRMHTDQSAGFTCSRHGLENCPVVHEKYSRVRHKQFEAGYALIDELFQLGQTLIRQIGNDHMKTVIDCGLALGFREPHIEGLIQRLATILHGEVDYCRRTADSGSASSCLEIVGGKSTAKRQIHMSVRIDSTGDDELVCSIDGLVESTCNLLQILPDENNGRARNQDVGSVGIDSGDNMSVSNKGFRCKKYTIGRNVNTKQ